MLGKAIIMSDELASLIQKAKVVYDVTGGSDIKQQKKTTIETKQQNLNAHMQIIDKLQQSLETESDQKSYHAIRLKSQLRTEKKIVTNCAKELEMILTNKTAKIDDVTRQNIKALLSQVTEHLPVEPRYEETHRSIDDFLVTRQTCGRKEIITQGQQKQIDGIHTEQKEQDYILDEMEKTLGRLNHVTGTVADELQRGNAILDNTIEKTKKTNTTLEQTTDRGLRVHKMINSRAGKLCVYIVFFSILTLLVYIFLRMAKL
jgi:hypothetical protein